VARQSIQTTSRAASVARAALIDAIPSPAFSARIDDAKLAVSELVSNAVKHGSSYEQDQIRLVIDPDEARLRVEVEQPLPALDVTPRVPLWNGSHDGGFGLLIVEAVADAWGVDPGPPGRVWVEFSS